MYQDVEGEKLQENNWLEDPTWSPEKLTVTMSKLKMKMTVKRYMTTQGKQIHKFVVQSMTVSFFKVLCSGIPRPFGLI